MEAFLLKVRLIILNSVYSLVIQCPPPMHCCLKIFLATDRIETNKAFRCRHLRKPTIAE